MGFLCCIWIYWFHFDFLLNWQAAASFRCTYGRCGMGTSKHVPFLFHYQLYYPDGYFQTIRRFFYPPFFLLVSGVVFLFVKQSMVFKIIGRIVNCSCKGVCYLCQHLLIGLIADNLTGPVHKPCCFDIMPKRSQIDQGVIVIVEKNVVALTYRIVYFVFEQI